MATSYYEEGDAREQHNHGAGAFIGRDNYGRIEMVDQRTKAILEKLSKDAPALGRLLTKALRDGAISEDVAFTLSRVAQHVNEDVAGMLYGASRAINEDVAHTLRDAATNINEGVAGKISAASNTLQDAAGKLEDVATRFDNPYGTTGLVNRLDEIAQSMSVSADRIDQTFAPLVVTNWRVTAWVAFWSVVAGVMIVIFLSVHNGWSYK